MIFTITLAWLPTITSAAGLCTILLYIMNYFFNFMKLTITSHIPLYTFNVFYCTLIQLLKECNYNQSILRIQILCQKVIIINKSGGWNSLLLLDTLIVLK